MAVGVVIKVRQPISAGFNHNHVVWLGGCIAQLFAERIKDCYLAFLGFTCRNGFVVSPKNTY